MWCLTATRTLPIKGNANGIKRCNANKMNVVPHCLTHLTSGQVRLSAVTNNQHTLPWP